MMKAFSVPIEKASEEIIGESKHDFSELRIKYPDFDERVKSIVAEREKK
jgi:hypothetical protein